MATPPWPEDLPPDSTRTVVRPLEDYSWIDALPLRIDADLVRREPIGRGGMGFVDAALQRSVDRVVAVKAVREDRQDPTHQGALVREGRVLGALEHPNIVPVYALGRSEDGNPLLVMKRIQGVSWSELLADARHADWGRVRGAGADRLAQNVEILIEVCRAVEFAHSKGFVHRDIKPQHVMLGHFGEVYLLDWGIAAPAFECATGGPVVGTLCFMAPEMLDGAATFATDVYLLGAVLHVLLCGRPPHRGDALAAMASIMTLKPRALPDDVAPDLAAACLRALCSRPEDRHPSAAAFREDLLTWLHRRVSHRHAERARGAYRELVEALSAAPPERRAVSRLYTDCRANLSLALEQWSENPAARDLVDELAGAMVAYELSDRNTDAAEYCLSELERWLRPEVVTSHRASIASSRAVTRELVGMLRELDPSISSRERAAAVAALAGLGAALLCARLVVLKLGWLTDEVMLSRGTRTMALVTALLAVGLVARRETLLRNQFNRRVFGLLMLVWLGTMANHGMGLSLDIPPNAVFAVDLGVWFVCALAAMLSLGGGLFPLVVATATAALATAVKPAWTLEITGLLGVAVAALGVRLYLGVRARTRD